MSRRLVLRGVAPSYSVCTLRRVWGPAVQQCSPAAYAEVFEGAYPDPARKHPGYVLHECAATGVSGERWFQWTLTGAAAVRHDPVLCMAWLRAAAQGLGRAQQRASFEVVTDAVVVLSPDGLPLPSGSDGIWRLGEARWPLPGAPEARPCRLCFSRGLHVSAKTRSDRTRQFVQNPDWPRVVRSAWNRVRHWLSREAQVAGDARLPGWISEAESRPAICEWDTPRQLSPWSSTQQKTLGYACVTGSITLPEGPGTVWPLVLAVHWLGVGHHTTEGLGGFSIAACLPEDRETLVSCQHLQPTGLRVAGDRAEGKGL